jgi:predicted RNase H-like HicB family nuclease
MPVTGEAMKTYLFRVELEQEDDGRWSAWIETLPGCAAWGYSKEEALEAVKETAQAYLEVLVEKGQRLPTNQAAETIDAPVVAVTL